MSTLHAANKFAHMGVRFKTSRPQRDRRGVGRILPDYAIDVKRDGQGEYFELAVPQHLDDNLQLTVMQVDPKDRHLLLMVRKEGEDTIDRFLCGHDERAWFVAAVPGGVSSIRDAKEALKPDDVRARQTQTGLSYRKRNRRRNAAFLRQGEWFFLPTPSLAVDPHHVLRDEPIQRGHGKPHMVDFVYRIGGQVVYTCVRYPQPLTQEQYDALLIRNPSTRQHSWRVMRLNPSVFAFGRVRHPDHKTIELRDWHRVLMNTENVSRTMKNVAFLD